MVQQKNFTLNIVPLLKIMTQVIIFSRQVVFFKWKKPNQHKRQNKSLKNVTILSSVFVCPLGYLITWKRTWAIIKRVWGVITSSMKLLWVFNAMLQATVFFVVVFHAAVFPADIISPICHLHNWTSFNTQPLICALGRTGASQSEPANVSFGASVIRWRIVTELNTWSWFSILAHNSED